MLYDDSLIYLLNLRNKQLVQACPKSFMKEGIPVNIQDMMVMVEEIDLEFVEEVCQFLMYEAYKKKQSCITSVLRIYERLFQEHDI